MEEMKMSKETSMERTDHPNGIKNTCKSKPEPQDSVPIPFLSSHDGNSKTISIKGLTQKRVSNEPIDSAEFATGSPLNPEKQSMPLLMPYAGVSNDHSLKGLTQNQASKEVTKRIHSPHCSSAKAMLVIVAVDNTKTAEHAFDWYAEHLHRSDNKVLIVHSIDMQNTQRYPSVFSNSEGNHAEMQNEVAMAKCIEQKFTVKLHQKQMCGTYITAWGKPGESLTQLANSHNAEMVIVGTRDRGQIKRTLLGSVSDYVIRHAHCAVVTVRKHVPI